MHAQYKHLGFQGRLGNQLWEIASTVGIARKLRCLGVSFNHWDYTDYFSVPSEWFVEEPLGYDVTEFPTWMPKSERIFLQDYSLFADIADEIRSLFTPSDLAREQLIGYNEWFADLPDKCALHVRRDERLLIEHTHPMPPMAYYRNAIELLGGMDAHNYVVFSDDIGWCRENMSGKFHFVDGCPRLQDDYWRKDLPIRDHLDLFLMAQCDQHVMPNSTYSWWGAFLAADDTAIYPAVWYGPSFQHIDASLQFPPGWREVGWN